MKNVLDLIHSDLCGPMPKSLGGSQYFMTFIDDHSRKTWAYTLKSKDQVLNVFKEFHTLVERQTGKKLKCIRTETVESILDHLMLIVKSMVFDIK